MLNETKPIVPTGIVIRNTWLLERMEDHLEGAIRRGYNRAYKHTDKPTEEQLVQEVLTHVKDAMSEMLVLPYLDADYEDEDSNSHC